MTTERPITDGTGGSAMLAQLRATRARIKRALLLERLAQALAFGLVAILVAVVLDRVLRLPPAVRVVELLLLLGGAITWFVMRVLPAIRAARGVQRTVESRRSLVQPRCRALSIRTGRG